MKAVSISQYGSPEDVLRPVNLDKPQIGPNDVLVKLEASSINPIECKAREGYGRKVFSKKRGREFPAVLGNDLAGVIVAVGSNVTAFGIGDEVIAAPPISDEGSYCEFRSLKYHYCVHKPKNLSFTQAATIPYIAQTTWQALVINTGISPGEYHGLHVLVHGGSGGIGSFAVQLLKCWGATVTTTCSNSKVERARSLGADKVIDYTTEDFSDLGGGYDVILDTVGGNLEEKSIAQLKRNAKAHYVTLATPILANTDKYGLILGLSKSLALLACRKIIYKAKGINYHWCMFKPNAIALMDIARLYEDHQILPVVDSTYSLNDIAQAHRHQESGKVFGKVAIKID